MPSRSQAKIRRDINRLHATIQQYKDEHPPLAVLADITAAAAEAVNKAWQDYQQLAVLGDKEREERDKTIAQLKQWIKKWRPIFILFMPGAQENIKKILYSTATPDDVIRVVEDMIELMKNNPNADRFRNEALETLGDRLEVARRETSEAVAILPREVDARRIFRDACKHANVILTRGIQVVRSIFGRTSPEYKKFIARSNPSKDKEEKPENE